jgi:hypothetical protein
MIERNTERDHGAPGMTDDDRALDAQHIQCRADEVGLSRGCPHRETRAIAVAESGAVEGDDAVPSRPGGNQPADRHVGDGRSAAVQQNDRGTGTAGIDHMQAHAAHADEHPSGRMPALSLPGFARHHEGGRSHCCRRQQRQRTQPAKHHHRCHARARACEEIGSAPAL